MGSVLQIALHADPSSTTRCGVGAALVIFMHAPTKSGFAKVSDCLDCDDKQALLPPFGETVKLVLYFIATAVPREAFEQSLVATRCWRPQSRSS